MNRKYILYIEDNPDQLELVRALLEKELPGVIVEVCCTAGGAEGFLNTRCYDVVICDVNLPGELGTNIAEKILQRDPLQPVYLMSEYTGPRVKEDAERIGLTLHQKFSQRDAGSFVDDIRRELDKRPCDSSSLHFSTGEAAATRDTADLGGETADRIPRPSRKIQLTSPHVLAVRAQLA